MALTKIGSIGINTGIKFAGVTTITTLNSATDTLTIGGPVSIAGTLTYEDVTNVDSIGVVTARDGIKVGSGITLSPDGDIFFTGIMTGNGSGLTGVANTDVIFPDKISFSDSAAGSINLGIGSDLQLYHDSNHSYIKNAFFGPAWGGPQDGTKNARNTKTLQDIPRHSRTLQDTPGHPKTFRGV